MHWTGADPALCSSPASLASISLTSMSLSSISSTCVIAPIRVRVLDDSAELASKYRSLQKDFDSAQTTILAQQSVVRECDRRLATQTSLELEIGEAEPNKEQLQARIIELEKEKVDVQNALANATNLITLLSLDSARKPAERNGVAGNTNLDARGR
ncbi:hypothetical protein PSPO01_16174 [Paraphaeosphaeria sporulosa]